MLLMRRCDASGVAPLIQRRFIVATEMLREEIQCARARQLCRSGVVTGALIAVETVIGGINVVLARRMRSPDLVDGLGRNALVAFAEVVLHRRAWLAIQHLHSPRAVVAHGRA